MNLSTRTRFLADDADMIIDLCNKFEEASGISMSAESDAGTALAERAVVFAQRVKDLLNAIEANPPAPEPTPAGALAIGTYVQTRTHGHRGRIYQVHRSCPEGAAWRMGQRPGLVGEHADGGGTWYSVLVQPSGSVVVPDYDIDVVEPFEFTNSYGDEHFSGLS